MYASSTWCEMVSKSLCLNVCFINLVGDGRVYVQMYASSTWWEMVSKSLYPNVCFNLVGDGIFVICQIVATGNDKLAIMCFFFLFYNSNLLFKFSFSYRDTFRDVCPSYIFTFTVVLMPHLYFIIYQFVFKYVFPLLPFLQILYSISNARLSCIG